MQIESTEIACQNMTGKSKHQRSPFGVKRVWIVYSHDLIVAGLSLPLALHLRFGNVPVGENSAAFVSSILLFILFAGMSFHAFGMYRGVWRYASMPDLTAIVKAVTIAVLVFMPAMFLINRLEEIPRSVPIIQWLLLVILLGGSRFTYRALRSGSLSRVGPTGSPAEAAMRKIPVLLIGTCADAVLFIRSIRGDPQASYQVVGLLDPTAEHVGRSIHGISVLGTVSQLPAVIQRLALRGLRPQRLIIATQSGNPVVDVPGLLERADELGLAVSRLPRLIEFKDAMRSEKGGTKFDLRPIDIEDLLERPQAPLNRAAISDLIRGRNVIVTGAGGTIGGELTRQIAALAPARLTLLDHSEFNLYTIDLEVRECHPELTSHPVLCNIRDRDHVMRLFAEIEPDLVFHAAALKHVPLVEMNPFEGLRTNVMGTRNVADAMAAHGRLAMVQVSTDKAINPTSMMGTSKRLAERYAQSLDLGWPAAAGESRAPRFITVRFGNVLGSSGSVVPLFQRQLAQGGPVTVTHPEIRRFFMTVREAVELVLQGSAYGVTNPEPRGQVFVLDMGRPLRIVDIARQMIRLAGLRPDVDVDIVFTGLRPGEKLYEELFDDDEERLPGVTDGILVAASRPIDLTILRRMFDELETACGARDLEAVVRLTSLLVSGPARQQDTHADMRLPA